MKKMITLILAMTMALSVSATAFAADTTINQDTAEPKNGSTKVTYTVAPSYTVTIPATVTLDGSAVEVKAEGVKVNKNSQVVVKLTGTSYSGNAFKVTTTEGAELAYTVKKGDTLVNIDDTVLSVNPDSATDGNGASGSTSLSFSLNDTIQYAGNYTGTVTFTVSVDNAP